jgi:hypothetical protein
MEHQPFLEDLDDYELDEWQQNVQREMARLILEHDELVEERTRRFMVNHGRRRLQP